MGAFSKRIKRSFQSDQDLRGILIEGHHCLPIFARTARLYVSCMALRRMVKMVKARLI
jgi:hypothetical protein